MLIMWHDKSTNYHSDGDNIIHNVSNHISYILNLYNDIYQIYFNEKVFKKLKT